MHLPHLHLHHLPHLFRQEAVRGAPTKDLKAVLLIQKMWRSKLSRRRYARWADIRKGRATPSEEKGAVAMQRSYRGFSARLKAQAARGHALLRGRGPGVPVDVVRDGQALDELLLQAAEDGDEQTVARLAHVCNLNSQPSRALGATPLMRATRGNHTVTALILAAHGARVDVADKEGRSSLSYAITCSNLTLCIAFTSAICGLAGDPTKEIAHFVSRKEAELLYRILASMDASRIANAATLLFVTNPRTVLLALVRAITVCRLRAKKVSMRDPAEAEPLLKAAMLVTTAIAAILENAELLINLPNGVYCGYQPDRRDLVSSILSDKGGQEALQMAAKYQCKHLLHTHEVRQFLEDQWTGQLLDNKRKEAKALIADSFALNTRVVHSHHGRGTVTELMLDGRTCVTFDSGKQHRFMPHEMHMLRAEHEMTHSKKDDPSLSTKGPTDDLGLKDLWVGAEVEHGKHGHGHVASLAMASLKEGKVAVEFDDGSVHYYSAGSLSKLTLVAIRSSNQDEVSAHTIVTGLDLLLATPMFLLQGFLLWLPLALWPPLSGKLRKWLGRHYLLEVPALRFFSSFAGDLLFFFSLTYLAHPKLALKHGSGLAPLINWFGVRSVVVFHLIWGISIFANELDQFICGHWDQFTDLHAELGRFQLSQALLDIFHVLVQFDDFIDVLDLFGPFFAIIALAEQLYYYDPTRRDQQRPTMGEEQHADLMLAYALALLMLGWRIIRLLNIRPSLGPLVLSVQGMLNDVCKWMVLQLTMIIGFTSAMYALTGSTLEGVYPEDACPMLTFTENVYHVKDDVITPLVIWGQIFLKFVESFLMQEASVQCKWLYSPYPEVAVPIMMLFQLTSAVLMVNMLIAMMSKTFDAVDADSTPFFSYLRSRVILTWVPRHPSPPPFNLITICFGKPLTRLVELCILARARRNEAIDTTGDGQVDTIAVDTSGDGAADKLVKIQAMMDTTGDGVVDKVGVDTTGDGNVDKVVKVEKVQAATPRPAISLVADYSDRKHTRYVAALLATTVKERMRTDSAPGVDEMLALLVKAEENAARLEKQLITLTRRVTPVVESHHSTSSTGPPEAAEAAIAAPAPAPAATAPLRRVGSARPAAPVAPRSAARAAARAATAEAEAGEDQLARMVGSAFRSMSSLRGL
jgi:ankyrin repeat protein